jgi:hypothetical protein
MTKKYVIELRDGGYVGGFVGVPPRLKIVAGRQQAECYPNRWAALEACNRGGVALHMARIVPYGTQEPSGRGRAGNRAKKLPDAPERR